MINNRFTVLSLLAALFYSATAFSLEERGKITSFVNIPGSVVGLIGHTLPEGNNTGAAYISTAFDPNLIFTESATLDITFLHEGAGYKNSLGYFTYTIDANGNKNIIDRDLLLPNASLRNKGGIIDRGDTITVALADGTPRVFTAGQYVGLFIVSNGWNSGTQLVTGWDSANPALPYLDPSLNAATGLGLYSSWDQYNPEILSNDPSLARHMALFRVNAISGFNNDESFFITGFEDLRRDVQSDEDFNDVVVMMRSTPESATSTTSVPVHTPGNTDPDGDGCDGMADYFPNDASRCTVVRTPATGFYTVAFEDNYPDLGDGDFNDAIVHFAHEEVLNAAGQLVDLVGTYHLTARGAGHDHAFGMAFEGLAGGETGEIRIQTFDSSGVGTSYGPTSLADGLYTTVDGQNALRVRGIIPSTRDLLPGVGNSSFTNTENAEPESAPASARAKITFATAIERSSLGAQPYDPFLMIKRGLGFDIHLPGSEAFPDRPAELPDETIGTSFKDSEGYPWVIVIPTDWRHPMEGRLIDGPTPAYSFFQSWRMSAGASNLDWYDYPHSGSGARVVTSVNDAERARIWTISSTSVE